MGLVLLTGCDDETGRLLLTGLATVPALTVQSHATLEAARLAAQDGIATVVVVGPASVPDAALAMVSDFEKAGSDIAAVLVASEVTTDLLRSAMRAGIREVLAASDGVDAIVAAIAAADDVVTRRRRLDQTPVTAGVEAPSGEAKVITVFSTKGGVGKSVLATNLGAALAGELGKKTILLDLDLQFGDVSVMLQLPPERTIYDAVQVFDRLDAEMLKGFLVSHDSGLLALLAPVQPEEAESVTTSRITQIISMLKQLAEYVVIDTPAALSEVVLTAVEQSDVVLAVATMDVPSVKNTKVSLQKLHQLGLGNGAIRLVLNRADSKVWLEPNEIEKAIADKIVARIPSDRLVPRSVNKGVPVVLDAPRSAVARSIVALAREVVEQ